jgi:hypothetical protein
MAIVRGPILVAHQKTGNASRSGDSDIGSSQIGNMRSAVQDLRRCDCLLDTDLGAPHLFDPEW